MASARAMQTFRLVVRLESAPVVLLRGEAADIQLLDDRVSIGADGLSIPKVHAEEFLGKNRR